VKCEPFLLPFQKYFSKKSSITSIFPAFFGFSLAKNHSFFKEIPFRTYFTAYSRIFFPTKHLNHYILIKKHSHFTPNMKESKMPEKE
jgi:hypothetical protein